MRGYSAIGIISPKNEANVGGVLRAAHCYGAGLVLIQGARYQRLKTDTSAAYKHIPLIQSENLQDLIPYDCTCVAVEFLPGIARNLSSYTHPERALYIFGGEDQTLDETVLTYCRDVVSISTNLCMNLAATVNVVLYDRLSKRSR